MYLASFAGSRDNNFNLVRLLAAIAVVVSHGFYLVLGGKEFEPGYSTLGATPGSLAVDVFFVVSGFLVTRSLEYRRSVIEFACARALRIFPGLAVNLVVVALGVGAAFTTVSLSDYYFDSGLVTYVLRNLQVLVLPLPFSQLPGLRIENGSLWTLPVEICCYLLLLCGWVICRHAGLKSRLDLIVSGIATLVAGLALWRYAQTAGLHLAWMFASGVLAHYLQARIKLSFRVAVVGLVVLVLSSSHRMAFQAAVLLVVPYLVLCASYLPGGRIRSFNRLGDYSYGVYIYGAPVQFSVLHLAPSAGVLAHVAMVVPIVIAVAAVSWHVVEKPSLRAVPRIVAALRRSMTPKAAPVGA